jgi:DNA-binding HxlR family transcriptional regulator
MNEKIFQKYGDYEQCPIRNIVDRIGDKWSILVIMLLEEGKVLRFGEICKYLGTISQKMLATTLKKLESDGLIKRTVYPEIPPKVEYELTKRGKSLLPHLHGLVSWAKNNMTDIKASREIFSNISG